MSIGNIWEFVNLRFWKTWTFETFRIWEFENLRMWEFEKLRIWELRNLNAWEIENVKQSQNNIKTFKAQQIQLITTIIHRKTNIIKQHNATTTESSNTV